MLETGFVWFYVTTPIFIISLFLGIYKLGVIVQGNSLYYKNNKGTLFGKTVFSGLFTAALVFPLFYIKDIQVWLNIVIISFAIVGMFEMYMADKKKKSLYFSALLMLTFVVSAFTLTAEQLFVAIFIAIIVDLLANFFGKQLSKLPDNLQFLRLKYPYWISKNKSLTSAILAVLIISFVFEYQGLFVFIAAISAVIGDAMFSIFKRNFGVDDYFPTLGSIGGILDRIDGWIFAIIFCSIYLNIIS